MHSNAVLIKLEGLCFTYPGRTSPSLDHLDFTLCAGDRIGLTGHNGCGKTTLFHLIMGLVKPSAGTLRIFNEKRIREKDFVPVRKKIGLLFQDSDDQLFCPTVLDDVAFGPLNMGKSYGEARDIAMAALRDVGLKDFDQRITHKLSGGEKRLVALATVLSMDPQILLLDEPTTGLDPETRERLMTILNRLDKSMILISHDHDFLSRVTHDLCIMDKGKILIN
ncbi:MAG: energy-coupling factor ABC transporter ATP-binding protein [Proteobacteria bacterium]|nr:energy-coupling factor ABC transporter ATP-binding protein [Pseudomonadota bacterium]